MNIESIVDWSCTIDGEWYSAGGNVVILDISDDNNGSFG